MIDIVGVRFKAAGKIYYFDPLDIPLKEGDAVIVETARGVEFGTVVIERKKVSEEDIVKALKPILRLADADDIIRHEHNLSKKEEALRVCEQKIENHGLNMKLVDMEYTFDNNKVIFYFTADGRVDFRELVRDLASHFRVRIELRQIGVRDQTKQLGGIGICGRECCCKKFLGDFSPISITMAKNQSMSLNPTKISGLCGRLLCCMRYENKTYEEGLKGMPNVGEIVRTPDGNGTVVKQLALSEEVRVVLKKGTQEEHMANYPKTKVKSTGKHDKDFAVISDFRSDSEESVDIKKLED